MQLRVGLRARTDFRVIANNGGWRSHCRGIELSSSGILLDRGRLVSEDDHPLFMNLEIQLPERHQPLKALVRPIWSFGTQQAFKFVRISDVDRLNLAEHLDLLAHRNTPLH